MKQEYTRRKVMIAGVLAAAMFDIAGSSASAQTTSTTPTTSPSAGVLTTTSTNPPATTATRDMINEAIQRSKARTAKLQTNGVPERFGSEEPFTYDPTK